MDFEYLIIGNSVAGIGAAEAIREVDKKGKLALVGAEDYPAYSRPAISYLLTGEKGIKDLQYRPDGFYEGLEITTFLGRTAVALDPSRREVSLDDGTVLHYGKLLLATGGVRLTPPIGGLDLEGIFGFINIADVLALKGYLERVEARRVVVIGGGLIGLQAAEALRAIGQEVTVVEFADRLLPMALDRRASRVVEDLFREQGVRVLTGTAAKSLEAGARGQVASVLLNTGEVLPADAVILAAGVGPRTELAVGAGLKVEKGIVVDDSMQTSDPGVYAAGDVAEAYDFLEGRYRPIPIWPNAYLEGRSAGLNMAGRAKGFQGEMVMNAFHFFGLPVITAGQYEPAGDGFELLEDYRPDETYYRRLVFRGENLVGLVAVGDAVDRCGIAVGVIRDRISLDNGQKAAMLRDFRLISLPETWRKKRIRGEA